MQVKVSQAVAMITAFIRAHLVPMLVGSPGSGKSQIVHQIAADYKLKVIDVRLAQCDPTDICGFPSIKGNKAGYVPMETFPIEGDKIPDGYNGWLVFLDEFSSASPAVQAASYKLVLDRMVGNHPLHKNVAIVCAGNLETDNAIVQPMSTALQSRLVHMELVVDAQEWVNWATSDNRVDHRITSYINFKPGSLYTFQPDHTDSTYASPRTWEFASRILQVVEMDSPHLLPMLAGTVSEGVAREFLNFCKHFTTLPKISEIVDSPDSIEVPDEPSILYALTGALSHNASMDNFDQLMKFIKRMPLEFQVVCLRETIRRNKAMLAHGAVQKWIASNATELF